MKMSILCAFISCQSLVSCASQSPDDNAIVELRTPQELVIFSKNQSLKEDDQVEFYWDNCAPHYIEIRQTHSHCEEKSLADGVVTKDLGSGRYLIKTASNKKIDKQDKFRKKGVVIR